MQRCNDAKTPQKLHKLWKMHTQLTNMLASIYTRTNHKIK